MNKTQVEMPRSAVPLYPYRSGITDVSYADQPWIIGQYSGYTSPEETNLRFRKLIAAGQRAWPWRWTCRRSWAWIRVIRWRKARWAASA